MTLKKEEEYKNMNKPNVIMHEFYSLSCTRKKDNSSHYCKYADNEKGVCLGIDTMVFKKYLEETLSLDLYRDYISFQDVIYIDGHEEAEIKKYFDYKLLCIKQPEIMEKEFLKMLWSMISEQKRKEFIEEIPTDTLSHFKPILKTKNYIDESEVRIIFDRNQFLSNKNRLKRNFDANDPIIQKFLENYSDEALEDASIKGKGSEIISAYLYDTLFESAKQLSMNSSPKFKVMSCVIRKYMELNMKTIWNRQPIKEVILGPNCKTNLDEFNEFLKENGVSCKAVKSNIKNRK
ncbi:MAG: DUF2971 domain-containing protein [Fibromonadaceae bacterium]|jgi:cellobiose-specific phosphotransferase system component IIB|nr:DUF2971 domain-containing protein [Fibromonadaceae bacterium]